MGDIMSIVRSKVDINKENIDNSNLLAAFLSVESETKNQKMSKYQRNKINIQKQFNLSDEIFGYVQNVCCQRFFSWAWYNHMKYQVDNVNVSQLLLTSCSNKFI